MRNDHRLIRVLAWLLPALCCLGGTRARGQDQIADWMIMTVCVDERDQLITGLAPIDPGCTRGRKIRAGEAPPYWLRGWPARDGRGSVVVKWNQPVVQSGVTRIVSVTERASAEVSGAEQVFNGVSVQWHDADYGFIMGSWSPVAESWFESPFCKGNENTSRRYWRGWIIGPATVPPPVEVGWGVFPGHRAAGAGGPCAGRYQAGFTFWITGQMAFRGATLTAIISHHYSQAAASGDAPGPARQVERTYWTREFGLTRWEKWARDDWVNPRTNQTAEHIARRLFAGGRCGTPFAMPARVTSGMAAEGLSTHGAYSQAVIDPRDGQRHVWFLTLCDDWTNLVRSPGKPAAMTPNPAFWLEQTR